ncbi:MAG TPA: DUF2924 domain-containing protein [Sphingomicrobium sp.]|jgi:hypothetical protein
MRSIEEALSALADMASPQLREEWVRLTGGPVPRISPSLLRLALAYELQVKAHGGLPRSVQQQLAQIAAAKTITSRAAPGMRLVRAWNGTTHVVVIGEGSVIRWNGSSWRSLSEVARAITGTRWSGPAFFGLKKKIA